MKSFFNKFGLTITILSIVITFYMGGVQAAEPTVRLQKMLTWDTKIIEIKNVDYGIFYFAEDETVYFQSGAGTPPMEIILENNEKIKEIKRTTGSIGFFIITEQGNVYARGDNSSGLLGLDELKVYNEWTKVPNLSNVKQITTQTGKTWFITSGKTYAVGTNTYGELGIGNTTTQTMLREVLIPEEIEKVYSCKLGYYDTYFTFFTTVDGKLYSTGNNIGENLGVTDSQISTPVKINGISNVKDINHSFCSKYYQETYFLTEEGEVYVTGEGDFGIYYTDMTKKTPECITLDIDEKIEYMGIADSDDAYVSNERIFVGENFAYAWKYKYNRTKAETTGMLEYKYGYYLSGDGTLYRNEYVSAPYSSNGKYELVIKAEGVDDYIATPDLLYVKNGELYTETYGKVDIPYVTDLNPGGINGTKALTKEYGNTSSIYYVNTVDGIYSIKIATDPAGISYTKCENMRVPVTNNKTYIGEDNRVYVGELRTIRYEGYHGNILAESVERYEDGFYYGLDGTIYRLNQDGIWSSLEGNGESFILCLEKVGKQPWPRTEKVLMDDVDSSAMVRYAFSTSDTYESVASDEWEYYDKNSGYISLVPPTSGIYYIHFEITQDDTVYKYVFGPYTVQLHGDTVVSNTGRTDYAYISADMRIPDEMSATFNLIFTPPQDIFLTNTLSSDPNRMFFGIIRNGNINIKAYDPAGNDISDKLDMGYVTEIYKNGVFVGHVSDNYLFTKRDPGAVSDNVYILKLGVGGIFKGVGNRYRLEFNGMSGYDSVTMQNLVPINTHKFTIDVYVTELPSLS